MNHRYLLNALLGVFVLIETPLGGFLPGQAQRTPPAADGRSVIQQLTDLLTPQNIQVSSATLTPSDAARTREVRVRWVVGNAAAARGESRGGPPATGVFNMTSQRQYAGTAPRQRALDIAPGRILIAALDGNLRLKSWILMADPRIVRSEQPGPDGTLTGQTLYMDEADFFVSVPDDPEIVQLRFYEPRTNGAAYTLTPLGSLMIR